MDLEQHSLLCCLAPQADLEPGMPPAGQVLAGRTKGPGACGAGKWQGAEAGEETAPARNARGGGGAGPRRAEALAPRWAAKPCPRGSGKWGLLGRAVPWLWG